MFADDGLEFPHGRIAWSGITEVRDGDATILLLQGPAILASIPKRVFASAADAQSFRDWILRRVGRREVGE